MLDHGRLRRPRSSASRAVRALRLRRCVHRPDVVDRTWDSGRAGRHCDGRQREQSFLFGEDACARVYAASGNGPVYRLAPTGAPSAPTCSRSSRHLRLRLGFHLRLRLLYLHPRLHLRGRPSRAQAEAALPGDRPHHAPARDPDRSRNWTLPWRYRPCRVPKRRRSSRREAPFHAAATRATASSRAGHERYEDANGTPGESGSSGRGPAMSAAATGGTWVHLASLRQDGRQQTNLGLQVGDVDYPAWPLLSPRVGGSNPPRRIRR